MLLSLARVKLAKQVGDQALTRCRLHLHSVLSTLLQNLSQVEGRDTTALTDLIFKELANWIPHHRSNTTSIKVWAEVQIHLS
jgi:hypothetical protein